jgi:hypothetical protein
MNAKDLFLRFGDLPLNGKSECHTLTGGTWDEGTWNELSDERRAEFEAVGYTEDDGAVYEPGVSVYGLTWDADTDAETLEFDAAASRPDDVDFVTDGRPAFLVSGDRLEITGFCGEPLLMNAEIVEAVELVSFRKGVISVRRTATQEVSR